MRLIDADPFGVVSFQGKSEDFIDGACFILDKIYEAPTIEERPQGEWEWQTEDKYRCTNCGEVVRVKEVMNVPQYNFCPMCSADMRKSLASYE